MSDTTIEDRIRADVQSILIETGRMPRLVYLVNPLYADAMVAGDMAAPPRFQLSTAGGAVTIMVDKWRPLSGFTRAYECACGALFIDDRSRSGKCSLCAMTTIARTVQEMTKPMHEDLYINTPTGKIKLTSDPTLGTDEFSIEQPRRVLSSAGRQPTASSTTCARCSHAFTSRPDGVVDEALENEIAAHQEQCVIVGDYVRWDAWPGNWVEGELTRVDARSVDISLCQVGPDRHQDLGVQTFYGLDRFRRIPRPQHGEAVDGQYREPHMLSVATDGSMAAIHPVKQRRGAENQPPAPVLYDGLTARECWHKWADNAHFVELRGPQALHAMTTAQIAAAKIENVAAMKAWPERLRAKISASAEAERNRVRVELQCDEDGEPW